MALNATTGGVMVNNNLTYFREKASLTRKDLGELVGVDRTLIWRYEKGLCQPKDETKKKIAKAIGKTVEEIFFSSSVAYDATNEFISIG